MKTIYLIGFMGAGKTTIGKALAKKIGYAVIDTDEQIVEEMHMTINEIFQKYGESQFRQLETNMLKRLPTTRTIVTTGGGMILREENRRILRKQGKVIFLYCHLDEIIRRLKDDTTRPLLKASNHASLASLYKERLPIYQEVAHLTIDTTNKLESEIVDEITACLD